MAKCYFTMCVYCLLQWVLWTLHDAYMLHHFASNSCNKLYCVTYICYPCTHETLYITILKTTIGFIAWLQFHLPFMERPQYDYMTAKGRLWCTLHIAYGTPFFLSISRVITILLWRDYGRISHVCVYITQLDTSPSAEAWLPHNCVTCHILLAQCPLHLQLCVVFLHACHNH